MFSDRVPSMGYDEGYSEPSGIMIIIMKAPIFRIGTLMVVGIRG